MIGPLAVSTTLFQIQGETLHSLSNRCAAIMAAAGILLTTLAAPSATAVPSVDDLFVCETIGGENFCTDMGFIDPETEKIVRAEFAAAVGKPIPNSGGDTSVEAMVTELLAMSPVELKAHQDAQLVDARESVWPEDLLVDVEEPAAKGLISPQKIGNPLPIWNLQVPGLTGLKVSTFKQTKDYYCGPASLALIARANGVTKSQATWANALGTTEHSGTGLANIVAEINKNKSWLKSGSKYKVLNVSKMSESDFKVHYKTRINGNRAIVLHPKLHKKFFSYLKFDHGGHFQVGYGYTNTHVKFIEVYNEADFMGKDSKGNPKGANSAGYKTIKWKQALESTTVGTTTALHTIGY